MAATSLTFYGQMGLAFFLALPTVLPQNMTGASLRSCGRGLGKGTEGFLPTAVPLAELLLCSRVFRVQGEELSKGKPNYSSRIKVDKECFK